MADAINAVVGGWFKVVLKRSGGTNYAWCLSDLPRGIVLAGCDSMCTEEYEGSPVNQTFYFLVTNLPEGTPRLAFQMICLSNPDKDVSNETVIALNISAPDNNPLGQDNFIQYSDNMAIAQANTLYGFPWVQEGAVRGNMKYGYPCDTVVKYGYPNQSQAVAACVMQDYGFPDDNILHKYGYPQCQPDNVVKYGYPQCQPDNVVKYGYPQCQPDNVVKYGYPQCQPDNVVKYGYPGCR